MTSTSTQNKTTYACHIFVTWWQWRTSLGMGRYIWDLFCFFFFFTFPLKWNLSCVLNPIFHKIFSGCRALAGKCRHLSEKILFGLTWMYGINTTTHKVRNRQKYFIVFCNVNFVGKEAIKMWFFFFKLIVWDAQFCLRPANLRPLKGRVTTNKYR